MEGGLLYATTGRREKDDGVFSAAATAASFPFQFSRLLFLLYFAARHTHTHTQSIDLSPKVYSCSWPCCRSSSSFQPLVNVYLLARVCVCVFLFFFFSFPLVYFSRHKKDELRLSISVPIPTTTVFASPPFQISGRESLGIIGG